MIPATASSQKTDEKSEVYEAMEILRLLEIIPDYYDYNTVLDEAVTRGEFVDKAAKLLNMNNYSGANIYYYDVPPSHFAYKSVSILTDLKIINGVGEKLFHPAEHMTGAAACKIILSILGYEKIAESKGGYPDGYIMTAYEADITDGLNENFITREQMYILLYRALTTPIITETKISSGQTKFESVEDETILSKYYDIYKKEGIVTGTHYVSLNGVGMRNYSDILIDDEVYESAIDVYEYIGEEVEFLVYVNEKQYEQQILWLKPTGKTKVLSIEADYIGEFDKQEFELSYYKDNGIRKTLKLDRGIKVIYNGREVFEGTDDIFASGSYDVKFIASKDEYDTAVIRKYSSFVVGNTDDANRVLYDKIQPHKNLKLTENLYDNLVIKKDGALVEFESITPGSVLSVYASKDNKSLEILICQDIAEGEIIAVGENEKGTEILVNASSYNVLDDVVKYIPEVGSNVRAYLNHAGEVAYIEVKNGEKYTAAYLIKTRVDEDNDVLMLHMLTQKGEFGYFECADKVTVDGVLCKSIADIQRAINNNGDFEPQLVLVESNADKQIYKIDTPYFNKNAEDENNTLTKNVELSQLVYRSPGSLQDKAVVDANTVIFEVPIDAENADESDYVIRDRSSLTNDLKYNLETYTMSKRQGYESFVINKVSKSEAATTNTELPILVKNVGVMINDEDEVVECIRGKQGGNDVEYPTDGEFSFAGLNLKQGMLVRVYRNNKDKIVDAQVIFDPNTSMDNYVLESKFNIRYGIEIGYVNDVIGDVLKISYNDPSSVSYVVAQNAVPVMIYDTQNEKEPMYAGSFADARTYYNVGEDCSRVVMIARYGAPRMFVIYL